jgi:phthalate 4,5-dioxygenase
MNNLCRSREQRNENFTGMGGIREQDIAIQENLHGPIADRTKEHLGTSDAGVIALRRRLLNAVRNLQAGREPPAPHCGGAYRVHPTASLMHRDASFEEVARSAMPTAVAE